MTRSSTEPMASLLPGPSVQSEHGLARKPPGHQVLCHLADLLPRSLQADVRRELPCGHEIGEPPQNSRASKVTSAEAETPNVTHTPARSRAARAVPRVRPPHGLDDQIVFWRARDLL